MVDIVEKSRVLFAETVVGFRKPKAKKRKASVGSAMSAVNDMKLKILYDNEAVGGFRMGCGFSCLVRDKNILFDTGADVDTLLLNMRKFTINPKNIEKIVLSHEHGDHTGGIRVLDYCEQVEVFVPRSFSSRFKGRLASHPNVSLNEIDEAKEIDEGVCTTGELGRFIKE